MKFLLVAVAVLAALSTVRAEKIPTPPGSLRGHYTGKVEFTNPTEPEVVLYTYTVSLRVDRKGKITGVYTTKSHPLTGGGEDSYGSGSITGRMKRAYARNGGFTADCPVALSGENRRAQFRISADESRKAHFAIGPIGTPIFLKG